MESVNRRLAIISHDLCMVAAAWACAYLTRYNFSLSAADWLSVGKSLPIVVLTQAAIQWRFGLYRGLWRFASIPDLWNITRSALLGTLAITLVLFLFHRMEGIPRTVLIFYSIYLILFLGAPRMVYRMWREHGLNLRDNPDARQVLILGAGMAGEMLARDMRRSGEYLPIGFLDDQERLRGSKVQGIPVLGGIDLLPDIARKHAVDVVIIALPSATNAEMRRVVGICEKVAIPFRTLPRFQDLVSGRASVSELRAVAIEDLLGRDPVSLDWKGISAGLTGKTVLVSGGGGSIGSELSRQIARLGPKRLVLFENNEYNLYRIERELRGKHPELDLCAYLGDVRDYAAVVTAFQRYKPEAVFHAAAYKHVPMLEPQAREAMRNNVMGTKLMASVADRCKVKTFVMISTDKAVNPANVMGASKRIAEIYCQCLNRYSETHFITVRFGNVLGSTGSVVPLFQEQIRNGGPVTVTHPEITRYFMTIPEAAQLILQAAAIGKGGEIFVLDMGDPIKISYLAEQLIRLSGKKPGADIEIVYTGLRPGEKLYEELFYDNENLLPTAHDKIQLARSQDVDWEMLKTDIRRLEEAAEFYNEEEIAQLMRKLVPEMGAAPQPHKDNVVAFNRIPA